MNIRTLLQGLEYRGRVPAIRQTYYVFEAKGDYLVISFARSRAPARSGYFNLVSKSAVQYVQDRLAGSSGVTARDVVSLARRTKHVPDHLVALNVLYVLVALGAARVQRIGEHRRLFFTVRSQRPLPHAA